MNEKDKFVATRSHFLIFTIILLILLNILTVWLCINQASWRLATVFVIDIPCFYILIKILVSTPKILIELIDGKLTVHKTRRESIVLDPADIIFISQTKVSRSLFNFGNINIETTKGVISLKCISHPEDVRRFLEFYKNGTFDSSEIQNRKDDLK